MINIKYGQLEKVCLQLGLKPRNGSGSKVIYKGIIGDNNVRISIHTHRKSESVPTGTLRTAISDLGFESVDAFVQFMKDNKIK